MAKLIRAPVPSGGLRFANTTRTLCRIETATETEVQTRGDHAKKNTEWFGKNGYRFGAENVIVFAGVSSASKSGVRHRRSLAHVWRLTEVDNIVWAICFVTIQRLNLHRGTLSRWSIITCAKLLRSCHRNEETCTNTGHYCVTFKVPCATQLVLVTLNPYTNGYID